MLYNDKIIKCSSYSIQSFAYERLEDIAWTLLIGFNSFLFPIMLHRNILLCFSAFSVRYLEIWIRLFYQDTSIKMLGSSIL